MCGFIAQLVEHRTGIAEVTGSNQLPKIGKFTAMITFHFQSRTLKQSLLQNVNHYLEQFATLWDDISNGTMMNWTQLILKILKM